MTATPEGLDHWVRLVRDRLQEDGSAIGDLPVEIPVILDLARDAAHGVARPAAPLTTFLLGYAAARAGGGADEVRRLAEVLGRLATEQQDPATGDDRA
ncbi:MAG: DUF6457 domain-containing protein [Leifsonia sp.]